MNWINDDNTLEYFNKKICDFIKINRTEDHWAPQSNFIYDYDGKQIVKHILKFENLEEEFNNLMSQYNIPLVLNMKENVSVRKYDVKDLNRETLNLINTFYHNDFINFEYKKI